MRRPDALAEAAVCLAHARCAARSARPGGTLVHCVAGRNRSATLAIAAVMLHERRPLAVVARRCFQRRPFILTNRSFRAQLVALADVHGLLHASEEPPDAGCSSEMLCSHCQQRPAPLPGPSLCHVCYGAEAIVSSAMAECRLRTGEWPLPKLRS